MDKKIEIIKNTILVLSFILYFYVVFIGRNQYIYNISYTECMVFMILMSLFIFAYGIITNNNKTYKSNIIMYIIFFIILLLSVTFFIGRDKMRFYNWWYSGQYEPFYTIMSQFKYGSDLSILKNIVGNSIMLIPLSFLLMIKNKKYNNILKQSAITLPIIVSIELLQAFTHTGIFDIDDIILNYLGTMLFTFIITRFHIIDRIRKLFYTDYKLKYSLKKLIFYISSILMAAYDFILFL